MKRPFVYTLIIETAQFETEYHAFRVWAWFRLTAYAKAARMVEAYTIVDGRELLSWRLIPGDLKWAQRGRISG